jgi:hypothetical protein
MSSATGGFSSAVDLYTLATRTWSTAQLSVARQALAATSVGNFALFAGGDGPNGNALVHSCVKCAAVLFLFDICRIFAVLVSSHIQVFLPL